MAVRSRPMQPKDVRECVEIIASHAVIGPRYGRAIADLGAAWFRLLGCEAKSARVFLAGEGPRAPICFVGVSVFVSDDFVRELKTPPGFWLGPELTRRIVRGDAPLLSGRQLRDANSCGGLNLLVWEGCMRPEFEQDNEILRDVMTAFIEDHRGFLWKEIISSQLESVERLRWMLKTGALWWNPRTGCYVEPAENDLREIVAMPHTIGVTRQIEVEQSNAWAASWVGALLNVHPPTCGFSHGEQQLLLSALDGAGGTDQELAGALGIAVSTVKKQWLSIYRRVTDRLPKLVPDHAATAGNSERGKEKRRRLLAYLRKHPEELRPVSRTRTGRRA
jgi:DNA-binding CsgD family transcriptional regulator